MIRTVKLLAALLVLFSCGNKQKEPAGILKPSQMQAVLWDVIRSDAFTTQFIARDSLKNDKEENLKLQQEIFAMHHTNKEEFYRSFEYYKKNSKEFKAILDSMINEADRNKPENNGKAISPQTAK